MRLTEEQIAQLQADGFVAIDRRTDPDGRIVERKTRADGSYTETVIAEGGSNA